MNRRKFLCGASRRPVLLAQGSSRKNLHNPVIVFYRRLAQTGKNDVLKFASTPERCDGTLMYNHCSFHISMDGAMVRESTGIVERKTISGILRHISTVEDFSITGYVMGC
jgi:hypothetical protein